MSGKKNIAFPSDGRSSRKSSRDSLETCASADMRGVVYNQCLEADMFYRWREMVLRFSKDDRLVYFGSARVFDVKLSLMEGG